MERIFTIKFWFPAAFLIALFVAALWCYWGMSFYDGFFVFLAVLFAGLPLPLAAGTFALSKSFSEGENGGIHIKSKKALDVLERLNTVILSKNGAILEGTLRITDIVPRGLSQNALLALAASAEREAKHPIGELILQRAKELGLPLSRVSAASEGESGAEAIISASPVRVGKKTWLEDEKVEISAELLTKADQLAYHGKVPVFVGSGKSARGIIAVKDDIAEDTVAAVLKLKRFGLATIMLTGENRRIAQAIQRQVNLTEAKGELTFLEKAREFQILRAKGAVTAAVGRDISETIFTEADLAVMILPSKGHFSRRKIETKDEVISKEDASALIDASKADVILEKGPGQIADAVIFARNMKTRKEKLRLISMIVFLILVIPAMGFFKPWGINLPFDIALCGNVFGAFVTFAALKGGEAKENGTIPFS